MTGHGRPDLEALQHDIASWKTKMATLKATGYVTIAAEMRDLIAEAEKIVSEFKDMDETELKIPTQILKKPD
jgi:hypothetical protein